MTVKYTALNTGGAPIKVAALPTPTEQDVGKIYFNTTDGNLYVGQQSTKFSLGKPVGDKIYFDTTKNPVDYVENEENCLIEISNGTDTYSMALVDILEAQGVSGYGHCYVIGLASPDMSTILGIAYIYCDVLDVASFNQMVGTQFGVSITEFGWQTNVIDTSAVADYPVTYNYLHNWDYLVYKISYTFEKLGGTLSLSSDNLSTILVFPAGSGTVKSESTFIPKAGTIYKFVNGEYSNEGIFIPHWICEGICVGNADGVMVSSIFNGYTILYMSPSELFEGGWLFTIPDGTSYPSEIPFLVYEIGTYTA